MAACEQGIKNSEQNKSLSIKDNGRENMNPGNQDFLARNRSFSSPIYFRRHHNIKDNTKEKSHAKDGDQIKRPRGRSEGALTLCKIKRVFRWNSKDDVNIEHGKYFESMKDSQTSHVNGNNESQKRGESSKNYSCQQSSNKTEHQSNTFKSNLVEKNNLNSNVTSGVSESLRHESHSKSVDMKLEECVSSLPSQMTIKSTETASSSTKPARKHPSFKPRKVSRSLSMLEMKSTQVSDRFFRRPSSPPPPPTYLHAVVGKLKTRNKSESEQSETLDKAFQILKKELHEIRSQDRKIMRQLVKARATIALMKAQKFDAITEAEDESESDGEKEVDNENCSSNVPITKILRHGRRKSWC